LRGAPEPRTVEDMNIRGKSLAALVVGAVLMAGCTSSTNNDSDITPVDPVPIPSGEVPADYDAVKGTGMMLSSLAVNGPVTIEAIIAEQDKLAPKDGVTYRVFPGTPEQPAPKIEVNEVVDGATIVTCVELDGAGGYVANTNPC
jgi:hypothetical protein